MLEVVLNNEATSEVLQEKRDVKEPSSDSTHLRSEEGKVAQAAPLY